MPRHIAKSRRQTISQLSVPFNLQKGKCPICHDKVYIAGKARAYDAETNSILCKRCSIMLGMAARSTLFLRKLIDYLERARVGFDVKK